MREKESHAIRNGIIATVIGGVLLSFWPPFLGLVKSFARWLWNIILILFTYLKTEHSVYGWIIVVLSCMSFILAIQLLSFIRKHEPDHKDLYTEDHLFGVDWSWGYILNDIGELWCLCPNCKSELVYSEFIPDPLNYTHDGKKPYTKFICERCGVTKARLPGPQSYALATVKREIRRKIRTEEWRK